MLRWEKRGLVCGRLVAGPVEPLLLLPLDDGATRFILDVVDVSLELLLVLVVLLARRLLYPRVARLRSKEGLVELLLRAEVLAGGRGVRPANVALASYQRLLLWLSQLRRVFGVA